MIKQYSVSAKAGGTTFPIRIKTELLKEEGWFMVEVNLRKKNALDTFTYSFSFYHKP